MRVLCLLTLTSLAFGLNADISAHGEPNRPVSKVINLIKGMLTTLEKEAEEDQEVYDKMVCWCETYDKEKTEAIAKAKSDIERLTKAIEEADGKIAQLIEDIKKAEEEVAEFQAALKKATTLRQEELAEFNEEEKDSLAALSALKAAVTVLKKHNGGASLLQTEAHMSTVVKAISVVANHANNMYMPLEHKRVLNAFLEENGAKDFFDAAPTFSESHAPQSGQIFGILQSMQETFESNLSASQKAEQEAQAAYEELKAAKEGEIKAAHETLATKKDDLANTKEQLEEDKVTLEDTKAQLKEDEEFLAMLKEKCAAMDAEWEARQKARALEIEACSKALAILNSDDAHDTFGRTFNFLQTSSSAARKEAAAVLNQAHSPKLAALAMKVKLDAFVEVIKAIDDMIRDLTTQQKDEVKMKDWCVASLNENEASRVQTQREISDAQAKVAELTQAIATCEARIEEGTKLIADTKVMMQRASENREAENHDFHVTVQDQKASIALLNQALAVMEKVYASLIQQKQDPPAGFKEYGKNEQGGGAVQMIKDIIADAEALVKQAVDDEAKSQKTYETEVKNGNLAIAEAEKSNANQNDAKSAYEKEKVETEEELDSKQTELSNLEDENAELHGSCDFLLKNFDTRQGLRQTEIDALNKAKQILKGAKFD